MEFVTISGTDMQASRISLGTWAIGGWMWGGTEKDKSIHTIHKALDLGINLIDTAPVYGFGLSEEIVGKAVKEYGSRDKILISSKVGLEWQDTKVFRNATPERITKEIEDSLQRLQTDYIDIYFVHWPDPLVDFSATAETTQRLLEQGKIRSVGVSNFNGKQMQSFQQGGALHLNQPPYNLFERQIESDTLPYCKEKSITVMAYGALCRGLLSGKVNKGRQFTGDDLRKYDPKFQQPRFKHYLKAVEEIDLFAREHHQVSILELSVRWMLDQGIDIAIWGARTPLQLEPVERISGWQLSKDSLEEIDRIIASRIKDPVGPEFMAPPARKN